MNSGPYWSSAELAEFERLTDEIESSDEAIRGRARVELSKFIETHSRGILKAFSPVITTAPKVAHFPDGTHQ